MNIQSPRKPLHTFLTGFTVTNLFVAGILFFFSSALFANSCKETPKWQPSDAKAHGVDVSHYQGIVRWDKLKRQGISFAFAKATGGLVHSDRYFGHNWQSMREEGILRGAYHFFHPADDAKTQAQHFVGIVKKHGGMRAGDLPPVLDVEKTDGVSSARIVEGVATWLKVVEQELGCQPIIYVGRSFADDHLGKKFKNYPLWIAEYTTR